MTPAQATESTTATLRRGLALSPELRQGLAGTLLFGGVATVGKVAIAIAVQQGVDGGLLAPGGVNLGRVVTVAALTAVLIALTTFCAYRMNVRLYTASETALARLRTHTFRHIHDLSMLHQQAQRRGSLVSRVTSDIDQLSQFLQFGGVNLLLVAGQLVIAAVVMAIYSWPLLFVVYAAFVPLVMLIRVLQRRLADRYAVVRANVGTMLAAIGESVVGAAVIRAYGVADRTSRRLGGSVQATSQAQYRAQKIAVAASQGGEAAAALATAGVIVVGVLLGVGGHVSPGRLTAFLFLVTLFVTPVQFATETLNDAQNAIAGWRRVLDIADLAPDVADPGEQGVSLPPGALSIRFDCVGFAYPGGPEVLSDVDLTIPAGTRLAVVGQTGGGKTTLAKLLVRLMDPSRGRVLLSGVPLPRVAFTSLRSRVVMVPQDGFLFDESVAENIRFGAPELSDESIVLALTELGLTDWVAGLPDGLRTRVGERGEELSVGERQLVALVRAYVADPDLLVLDEATSAVDPATEVRVQRTLDAVTRGRTTVAIAHRLATARAADEVLVVDHGKVVQRGPHEVLVRETGSVYARLYASWLATAG